MSNFSSEKIQYLNLLSKSFPNIAAASTEIINLCAILRLPKGTEHFISDIHGEYDYFNHIIKNASGSIHRKINDCFGDKLSEAEKNRLALLVYYPEKELAAIISKGKNTFEWYHDTLIELVKVTREATSKYTRSKVRKALPKDFEYIIDELINTNENEDNKQDYYENIIETIIYTDRANDFIIALSNLINRMVIDQLHILGDIFDRGSGAHFIMDDLCNHHNVDFVWGNHDILWMGASLGQEACIAVVLRNSIRYSNMDTLEDGYGINVRPLALFASQVYADDPCTVFMPKHVDGNFDSNDIINAKIHKAIAVIQFKLEGQLIKRHPEYNMKNRLFMDSYNKKTGEITIDGITYKLLDTNFPTLDMRNPYKLSPEEESLMQQLKTSFRHSEKLKKHIRYLFDKGAMYRVTNNNLMFHGCIPMEENGTFSSFKDKDGYFYSGKSLLDYCDRVCRQTSVNVNADSLDFFWYLWCGPKSPLNGKDKMSTFERYFIDDKQAWNESKDPYYSFIDNEESVKKMLQSFGVNSEKGRIINGHVPVKIIKGESPIKAGGKLLIIDGGLSKAYQPVTGIGGYTLVFNSNELYLAEHHPFNPENAVHDNKDMHSNIIPIETYKPRLRIMNTDIGVDISRQIADLQDLLNAFKDGSVKQRNK